MATNDDGNDLSRELEEPGLPDLQQELQNAAIEEMNNVTYGDDVVNDNISDLDNDSEGGEDDDVSVAPSVAQSMASHCSQRSAVLAKLSCCRGYASQGRRVCIWRHSEWRHGGLGR